ncbi:unnamed protein product [Chrysoparadoxa australica]
MRPAQVAVLAVCCTLASGFAPPAPATGTCGHYTSIPTTSPYQRHVLEMGRRKGNLKGQLDNKPSKKAEKKKLAREIAQAEAKGAQGGAGAAPDLGPGQVTGAAQPSNTLTVMEEESEEPQVVYTGKASLPGQEEGEGLIQYAKRNGLAVDLSTMDLVPYPKRTNERNQKAFPQPTEEQLAKYGMGPSPSVEDFVSGLEVCLPGESTDLEELKQFLIANRQHAGNQAIALLVCLKNQEQSKLNRDRAWRLQHLLMGVMKAESSITGVFRQAIKNAETRLAPKMGSPDPSEYVGSDECDANASWIVLKACIAEWERRNSEMRGEDTSMLDLVNAPQLAENKLDKDRTAKVCQAVQMMGATFKDSEQINSKLLPELRFLDAALGMATTTEVRRYALQEFCQAEGWTPDQLKQRVRSLLTNMDSLHRSSYGQLQIAIQDIYDCLADGTPEAYNIYVDNVEKLGFEVYDLSEPGPEGAWRRVWKRMIAKKPKSDAEEEDYTKVLSSLGPDLSGMFGAQKASLGSETPRWLELLDGDFATELERGEVADDGTDDWRAESQADINDIYSDFMELEEEAEQAMAAAGTGDESKVPVQT